MIEIRGLSFRYAGESRDALHNIDMTVEDGDFIGVTGPSGAGKTTLTQALSGLVPHRRAGDFFGSVAVNGVDTVDSSLTALALHVGSVFQDIDSQMVAGQVEDEILFGLENFGVDRAEIPRRIDEALDDVGIAPLRHRAIDSLSGGQKQKVAIAAILALRPKTLVLDEPTGELDPGASEQIFRLLRRMNEAHGMTVIVVEQKIMLLSAYAKKLAVLNDGQLELFGPVREVLRHSARLEAIGVHCPRVVTLSNRLADLTGGALAADLDYKPGDSVLHRLDPLTKIFLSVCICAACFLGENPAFLVFLIGCDLLLGALGGVFDRAAGMLKGLLKLSVFLFVLQLLFVRTGAPLLSLPPLLVTDRGVMTGLRLVLRLIGATMPLALLLSVTQMSDLSGVLVQRLHVPYKYAFTLTTAIRFIPVFADSLSGIMEAQTARGVAFDTKNPFKKLGLILPLCMPLLISSVGRIHDTAAAAEMRGFTLRTRESQSRRYTFKSGDLFAALIAAALVAAGALL